jgi:DNA-binding response OmpR family regulator
VGSSSCVTVTGDRDQVRVGGLGNLNHLGYAVDVVRDGAAALDALAGSRFDAVLMVCPATEGLQTPHACSQWTRQGSAVMSGR